MGLGSRDDHHVPTLCSEFRAAGPGRGEIEMQTPADDEVRVLFVEDDADLAEMYRLKLELDGYTVTRAADGEEGLRMAKAIHPDIVFLDIRLPRMDGFQALERMRADEELRHIPVIILSNYGENELVERGLKLGPLEYLIKPQTPPPPLPTTARRWLKQHT